jgi:hypothetical protein
VPKSLGYHLASSGGEATFAALDIKSSIGIEVAVEKHGSGWVSFSD